MAFPNAPETDRAFPLVFILDELPVWIAWPMGMVMGFFGPGQRTRK
jgi:hypothetical protein